MKKLAIVAAACALCSYLFTIVLVALMASTVSAPFLGALKVFSWFKGLFGFGGDAAYLKRLAQERLANGNTIYEELRSVLGCEVVDPQMREDEFCIEQTVFEDELQPVPADKAWKLPIWQAAGKRYDVPWELLAAIEAARTAYGELNCPSTPAAPGDGIYRLQRDAWKAHLEAAKKAGRAELASDEGGQRWRRALLGYGFSEGEVARFEAQLAAERCFVASPPARKKPDLADANRLAPHDAVVAAHVMARWLAKKGAVGDWDDYSGPPAIECLTEPRLTGPIWRFQGAHVQVEDIGEPDWGSISGLTPYQARVAHLIFEIAIQAELPSPRAIELVVAAYASSRLKGNLFSLEGPRALATKKFSEEGVRNARANTLAVLPAFQSYWARNPNAAPGEAAAAVLGRGGPAFYWQKHTKRGAVFQTLSNYTIEGGSNKAISADWRRDVLVGIKAPLTANNYLTLAAWRQAESGSRKNPPPRVASFNPFNTTRVMPGSWPFNYNNGFPVQNYPEYWIGIKATVETLLNGHYDAIVTALRSDAHPLVVAKLIGDSVWGTHGPLIREILELHYRELEYQNLRVEVAELKSKLASAQGEERRKLAERLAEAQARFDELERMPRAKVDPNPLLGKPGDQAIGMPEQVKRSMWGKKPDAVSQALFALDTGDPSEGDPCEVAIIREWYEAIVESPPMYFSADGRLAEAVALARRELAAGVREEPDGCNCGAKVEIYLRSVGAPAGTPWCAAFLSWIYQQVGVQPITSSWANGGRGSAAVFAFATFARERKILRPATFRPRPGDLIFYGDIYSGRGGGASHIGMVVERHPWGIMTIEGNSSNAVRLRELRWSDMAARRVAGFGDLNAIYGDSDEQQAAAPAASGGPAPECKWPGQKPGESDTAYVDRVNPAPAGTGRNYGKGPAPVRFRGECMGPGSDNRHDLSYTKKVADGVWVDSAGTRYDGKGRKL
jgi:hypothetical protein